MLEKDPILKSDVLIELSKQYRYISTDSSKKVAKQALKLSQEIKYKEGECRAYSLMGSSFLLQEKDSLALHYYKKGLKIAEEENLDLDRASILSNMGAVYVNLDEYNKAISNFKEALEIDIKFNNLKGQASRLNNISTIYLMQNDYKNAVDYMFKGIELLKKEGDESGVGMIYNNVALVYQDQKEYDKSIRYLKKAEKIFLKEKQDRILQIIYTNLGDNYNEMGDKQKAIKYLQKAITYGNKTQNPCINQNSLYSLARIFVNMDKVDSAEIIAKQALLDNEECKSDDIIIPETNILLSEIMLKKGNLNDALGYASKAYEMLQEENVYKLEKSIAAKLIADIYTKQKNYERALYFTKIYYQTQDSILNESNIKEITKLESEHKFELEKQVIDAKNKAEALILENKVREEKNLRNLFIIIGIVVLIFLVIFYRLAIARKKANQELKEKNTLVLEQKKEIEKTHQELVELSEHKEFFTQMIAHDLKNPLNIINVFSALPPSSQNTKFIKQASTQMYSLVNNMLDVRRFESTGLAIQKNEVNISEVVNEAILRSGLLLQTKSITTSTDIDESLVAKADWDLLTRVLENIVTNAAKYSSSGKAIKITALLNNETNTVELKVIDEGFGIEEEAIPLIFDKYWQVNPNNKSIAASTGLGLAFCKLVVEAHKGTISVTSEIGKGTTFTIILPEAGLQTAGSKKERVEELNADEILPKENLNNNIVLESIASLKALRVFKAGAISTALDSLDEFGVNKVWKSKVLAAVFSGNQKEYDKLMAMV
jgi:signal transduction histidine kinase/Flp pilus assembly protein TadD